MNSYKVWLSFVMLCAIWYHSCNFKNVKNTHGGALILVKVQIVVAQQPTTIADYDTLGTSMRENVNFFIIIIKKAFSAFGPVCFFNCFICGKFSTT